MYTQTHYLLYLYTHTHHTFNCTDHTTNTPLQATMPSVSVQLEGIFGKTLVSGHDVDTILDILEKVHRKCPDRKLSELRLFLFQPEDERVWIPITDIDHLLLQDDMYACIVPGLRKVTIHVNGVDMITNQLTTPCTGQCVLDTLTSAHVSTAGLQIVALATSSREGYTVTPNTNIVFGSDNYTLVSSSVPALDTRTPPTKKTRLSPQKPQKRKNSAAAVHV